jgi:hypothetical protein
VLDGFAAALSSIVLFMLLNNAALNLSAYSDPLVYYYPSFKYSLSSYLVGLLVKFGDLGSVCYFYAFFLASCFINPSCFLINCSFVTNSLILGMFAFLSFSIFIYGICFYFS